MVKDRDYELLLRENTRLRRINYTLNRQVDTLENKLAVALAQIARELLPRIEREKKSYDTYVLNGGSDLCTRNGIMGRCGTDCEAYGSKPDCPGLEEQDEA